MKRLLVGAIMALVVSLGGHAIAAEQSVRLAVDNMTCASCPYIVKKSMAAVDGVLTVDVSFETEIATVTFDDAKTSVQAIAAASGAVGFPATPVDETR